MARLSDILQYKWPGSEWTIKGDDYESLQWFSKSEKPTLDAILSFNDEVDVVLKQLADARKRQNAFDNLGPDIYLKALDALSNQVKELREHVLSLKPGAVFSKATEVEDLVAKIASAKVEDAAAEAAVLKG